MTILHLVNRSPSGSPSLQQAVCRCRPGDGILLIKDGVYGALRGSAASSSLVAALNAGISIYCLNADLETRGIEPTELVEDVELVDYSGFVDLSIRFPRSLSW